MSANNEYLTLQSGQSVPEQVWERYCELIENTKHHSKKKNFYNVLRALILISIQKNPCFDYAEIVRVIENAGWSSPSYTTIVNATGKDYQELIGLYIKHAVPPTEKAKIESEDDHLLSYVSDRQAKIRLREKLHNAKSLYNQLNILKHQISKGTQPLLPGPSTTQPPMLIMDSNLPLTIGERDAIKEFLNNFESLGFFENELGALMEPGGIHEFAPVGFLSALRKIIQAD